MKAYVINMKRSIYRRKSMEEMLTKLGLDYEITEAIDGKLLTDNEFLELVRDPKEFTRSQTGCALSHINVYRKILEGTDEYALVLEDDVKITEPHFKEFLEKITPKLNPNNVTVLTYFWCRDGHLSLNKQGIDKEIKLKETYYICSPSEIHGIGRAAAYIVSKKTCKDLINFNYPLFAQADSWVVFYENSVINSVDCVYPMPITENEQFGSEIEYTQTRFQAFLKKVMAYLVNHNAPIISDVIKSRRRAYSKTYKNIRLLN